MKIDKIIGVCLVGIIVLYTSVASADILEIPKCQKNQYMAGKVCKACPSNATCDGVNATCKNGYENVAKSIHEIICKKIECPKNQYVAGNVCEACPEHATCNGVNAKCEVGYENVAKDIHRIICKEIKCSQSEYRVNGTCVKCPEHAVCDGINANCPAGYTKSAKGYITCKSCGVNAWLSLSSRQCVTTCPENAECDGWTAKCKKGYAETAPDKGGPIKCVANCPAVKKACLKTQYKVQDPCDKCVTCPSHATCNGSSVTCKEGYVAKVEGKYTTCVKSDREVVCPAVKKACLKTQYMIQDPCDKCVACPLHATCNGSSATCNEGYVSKVVGKYTTCVKRTAGPIAKPTQPKGHAWGKKGLKRR